MVKTETITINGNEFIRTYSDRGFMVERDGIQYDEAIDPVEFDRTYTETETPTETEATEADYISALEDLGVKFGE